MEMKSEKLNYWQDGKPAEGYKIEEESIVKAPLHAVEDQLFAFIMGLMY